MNNELVGTLLPRVKTCSCGLAYTRIPGPSSLSADGHLWFDCPACKSTLLLQDFRPVISSRASKTT